MSTNEMDRAWKEYVRPGLRSQEVLDLFDYNDFHWNRRAIFEHLAQSIVDGRYRPSSSHPHRLEKKHGVCRTVVLPTPEDAVVLQCIADAILPKALKKQPSRNAFFSRSHSGPNVEVTFGTDYIWFKRWPEFSKKRNSLSTAHPYVVTTDISTFYDNIKYSHLRNIISEIDDIPEVILDVLFEIVDRISWRPDYLPSMNAGLPQVQFDAPRLLSHVYLFEIDGFLKRETAGAFVRWVDDITFGVESRAEGKRILRDIDALLQLRGIRLNSGKTAILSKAEARTHFYPQQNAFLDKKQKEIEQKQKAGRSTARIESELFKRFQSFKDRYDAGQSDKIKKRYIGIFGRLNSNAALRYCNAIFASKPSFRETILRYYTAIGRYPSSMKALTEYIKSDIALDDASICQVARCLTMWKVPVRSADFRSLGELGTELSDAKYLKKSYFYLIASLWLLSKYGDQKQLREVLRQTEEMWSKSEFLSRQVAASASKFRVKRDFDWVANKVEKHGFQSAISVVNALRDLQEYTVSVPEPITLYCTNGNNLGNYSVQRFLVTFRVASSRKLDPQVRSKFIRRVSKYITDPHYLRVLKKLDKSVGAKSAKS